MGVRGGIVRIQLTTVRAVDQNIAVASLDGVYRTEEHLRRIQASRPAGIDPAEFIQSHVRRLEALRRARIVERVEEGIWRIPADLPARGLDYDRERTGGAEIRLVSPMPIERQRQAIGATWLDQQLIANTEPPASEFGRAVASALREREQVLIDQGLARRQGPNVILPGNLLGRLKERELESAAAGLERSTGLSYRPTIEGVRVSGKYRQTIQLASGKFAMLDDGWKPAVRVLGTAIYAATSTYSTRLDGGGIGVPSSRMPSRWNSIASRMAASASPGVLPVATHPGRSGTYAE